MYIYILLGKESVEQMNVITAPPKGPFVKKEMPQRSTRRGAAALRDISNQVAVSNPADRSKKASKVAATFLLSFFFFEIDIQTTSSFHMFSMHMCRLRVWRSK